MQRLLLLVIVMVSILPAKVPSCVTHIPPGRHTDFIWPFKYIPRAWTAHASCHPPKTLIGADNDADGDDVPDPGHGVLQFSWKYGPMFSYQTKKKFLVRIGTCRYDFVDHYYDCPTLRFNRH
jgi:hypothetical protein